MYYLSFYERSTFFSFYIANKTIPRIIAIARIIQKYSWNRMIKMHFNAVIFQSPYWLNSSDTLGTSEASLLASK